jgi:mono/diheme cytochrome c family protein
MTGAPAARRAAVAILLTVVTLLGGACTDTDAPELSGDQASDPELVTGRAVYEAECARCHGGSGGGGAGPKLSDGRAAERFPDPADQEAVVRNGRGTMPSWEGKLSDEEISAVVRYTREAL